MICWRFNRQYHLGIKMRGLRRENEGLNGVSAPKLSHLTISMSMFLKLKFSMFLRLKLPMFSKLKLLILVPKSKSESLKLTSKLTAKFLRIYQVRHCHTQCWNIQGKSWALVNNLHAISLITQYGLVAQGLEHCTRVTGSWVQSPAGSLLLIHPCDQVWNLVNSYTQVINSYSQ